MKTTLVFLILCLIVSLAVIAWLVHGPPKETGTVSIAIRVADRGAGQPDEEYYGVVDKQALQDLRRADVASRFIRLTDAYWMINGKQVPISDSNANGIKYGYDNTVYIRLASVYRIIELQPNIPKPPQ